MKRTFNIVAACYLFSLVTGCATLTTGPGPEIKVRIASIPSGANVLVDGQDRGMTPLVVALSRKDYHHIVISKAGYEDHVQDLRPGPNPWFFGNILIGGVIGMAVDMGTGAVVWLNPPELAARMKATPVAAIVPPVKPSPPLAGTGVD